MLVTCELESNVNEKQAIIKNRIHSVIGDQTMIRTFVGTSNFTISLDKEKTSQEFWICFKDLMGYGAIAFSKNDKAKIERIHTEHPETLEMNETYMKTYDKKDGNFIVVKISMHLKRICEKIFVSNKTSYVIVDMKKERLFRAFKRSEIVKIVEGEHDHL